MTRGTIELPSISETFQNLYRDNNQSKCQKPIVPVKEEKHENFTFNYEPQPQNYHKTSFGKLVPELKIKNGGCKINKDKRKFVDGRCKSDNSCR